MKPFNLSQHITRSAANAADYGATGNDSTDDSAAFNEALTARRNVTCGAGDIYSVKDVQLSNSASIRGNNTIFVSHPGSTNIFRLADYDPRVGDLRINTHTGSAAAIRIAKSRTARVTDITAANVGYGFIEINPDNPDDVIALAVLSNLQAEDVAVTGIYIGSNVSEIQGGNIHLHGRMVDTGDGFKTTPGSVGWRQSQPLNGTIARGGHQLSNMNMIGFETGWYFSNVELIQYENLYADTCSGFGIKIDGTGNAYGVQFTTVFIGASRGYSGGGNSDVSINGLETKGNGQIFDWLADDFYTGTAYDVTLTETAKLTISGYWRGDKKLNIATTAKLVVNVGTKYLGRTQIAPAANTTNYLAEWGFSATELSTVWRAPCAGKIIGMTVWSTVAPGAGQTYTVTLRKNFADTAMVAVLSGASDFGKGDYWSATGGVAFNAGEVFSIKLVTSVTAAAGFQNVVLHFVPD